MSEARDLRLISFRVASEIFVIDIMSVRQIIAYSGTSKVPTAPRFVEGIVVVRDEVIPVVDLRKRLYSGREERAEQPLVLITDTSAGRIGFKVDEVRRILNVSTDALLPPPPLIRGIRGELLIGIVPHGEDDVHLLLDVEQILTDAEKEELRG